MAQHIIIATRTRSAQIYYFSGYRDHHDGWDRVWTENLFWACHFEADEAGIEMLLLADASDASELASMRTCPWVKIPNRAWR